MTLSAGTKLGRYEIPFPSGPPKELTIFTSERIFNLAWSRDGEQLALSRGTINRDVVLITGFK